MLRHGKFADLFRGGHHVMVCAHDQAAIRAHKGLLEPLDWSMIDQARLLLGSTNPRHAIIDIVTGVIAWNAKRVAAAAETNTRPQVWSVKRFPADRVFRKKASETLEVVLMCDGMPPSTVYPMEVPRVLRGPEGLKRRSSGGRGTQTSRLLSGKLHPRRVA
jgi:putative spermidine/putrescine transport system substrate-binding protein